MKSKWLLGLLIISIVVFLSIGCAGGSDSSDTDTATSSVAPTTLSYSTNSAAYTVGTAISTNSATVDQVCDSWTVNPALPAGLSLDSTTGAISGTPSNLQIEGCIA